MVEENSGAGEQPVALAVVHGDVVAVGLGDTVRAARMERRRFGLRDLANAPEHLAGGCLVEAGVGDDEANRFEQATDGDRVELGGQHRLAPRGRHERLCREVVDLVGFGALQDADQGHLVEEIRLDEIEVVGDVGDAAGHRIAGVADRAEDPVSLLEQQLREIGAVLSGDAGDDRAASGHARGSVPVTRSTWATMRRAMSRRGSGATWLPLYQWMRGWSQCSHSACGCSGGTM